MLEAARAKIPPDDGGEGSAATATSDEDDAEATLLFELLDLNRDGNLSRIEVVGPDDADVTDAAAAAVAAATLF
jgi:hypothetical protein